MCFRVCYSEKKITFVDITGIPATPTLTLTCAFLFGLFELVLQKNNKKQQFFGTTRHPSQMLCLLTATP